MWVRPVFTQWQYIISVSHFIPCISFWSCILVHLPKNLPQARETTNSLNNFFICQNTSLLKFDWLNALHRMSRWKSILSLHCDTSHLCVMEAMFSLIDVRTQHNAMQGFVLSCKPAFTLSFVFCHCYLELNFILMLF